MTQTNVLSKPRVIAQIQDEMEQAWLSPKRTIKEKIVLTCRILFSKGQDSGLAGQITARIDNSDDFVTQAFSLGFDEITEANLLTVNNKMVVIEGVGIINPANQFHIQIYSARSDVKCIIHTHPLHLSVLSMLGCSLSVTHMDSCMLYDDIAYLQKWPGIPVSNNEGEIISKALGSKRGVLLAHHGLLIAGETIEQACVLAIQCEHAAKLQLMAMSAGNIQPIDSALAKEAHDWLLFDKRIQATFNYYVCQIKLN
jgi:L-fuculose-phosphate aldolase